MSSWWTGMPAAEVTVACGGGAHTLRWEAGELNAVDHGDPKAEATLAALAGQPVPCLQLLGAWHRRRDDPRVLTLASRGPLDPLTVKNDQHRHPHAPKPRRSETELLELLALGGGLPDRLQAHTAATWTRRLGTGHSSLEAALPQLRAALYGRALATVRLWLGEPGLSLDLTMTDAASPRTIERTADGVRMALPFAWLPNVWARGLGTIFGRLCLQADTDDGVNWTLDTLDPALRERARLAVSFGSLDN